MVFEEGILATYTTTRANQTVRLTGKGEYFEDIEIEDGDCVMCCRRGDVLFTFRKAGEHKVALEPTSGLRSLAGMFAFCFDLTAVDFTNYKMRGVEDVRGMFAMTGLKSIDLSMCNALDIEQMAYMFSGCVELKGSDCNLDGWPLDRHLHEDVFRGCVKI